MIARWLPRIALVALITGLVAATLPGVKQRLAIDACADGGGVYDYDGRVCRTGVRALPARRVSVLQVPDGGSVVVAAVVAIAMVRLFLTLDRRARR